MTDRNDRRDRSERLLDAFLGDMGSAPLPDGLARDVRRRIREERPARQLGVARWLPAASIAMVAVVLVGVAVLGSRGPTPPLASAPPAPSASPEWQVDLGAGHHIVVDDRSGFLARAQATPIAPDGPVEPAIVPGADASSIVVRFRWSSCSTGGVMTIAADRTQIALVPIGPDGPCAGAVGSAAVELSFRASVVATAFAFAYGAPARASSPSPTPPASPVGTPTAVATPGLAPDRFQLTLDSSGRTRLPVLVLDSSLGIAAQPVEARHNLTTDQAVEVVQGSARNKIIVAWVGGACDELTVVSIDAARTAVTVGTWTLPGGCDAIGFDRGIELTFGDAVDASSIRAQIGAAPIAGGLIPRQVWFSGSGHGYVAGTDAMGASMLAETDDGGKTWTTTVIGWGGVVGLGAVVGPDIVERPVVALVCAAAGNGGATEPGCTPGVYRREGSANWTLVDTRVPLAMATRGNTIAVLVEGKTLPNASYPLPPADLRLSSDGGATWASAPSPCGAIPMGSSSIALDADGRPVVVCGGTSADGSVARRLERASKTTLPTAWTTMPPLPGGQGMQLDLGADGHGLAWEEVGSSIAPTPLYLTTDGGASWTPRPDVADGETLIVEDASAFAGGGSAVLSIDQARSEIVLLLSPGGRTWGEVASFPG
ncbi:MAG: hypothetical protein ACYDAN_07040 [Candidatus Limnocylindrales bacterium]